MVGVFALFPVFAALGQDVPIPAPELVYATYVGTGRNSTFQALAVDFAGFAFVGGAGPAIDDASTSCTFLTKLNQSGTAALWTTCLPLARVDSLAWPIDFRFK